MIGIWGNFVLSSGSNYVCRVDTCFLSVYLYIGFTIFYLRALNYFDMVLRSFAAWDYASLGGPVSIASVCRVLLFSALRILYIMLCYNMFIFCWACGVPRPLAGPSLVQSGSVLRVGPWAVLIFMFVLGPLGTRL